MTRSLDAGAPLAYKVAAGKPYSPPLTGETGRGIFTVAAWQLAGHQREAVVAAGAAGDAWRVASDEGLHLKGTDLAPYPFQFFNAGVHADLTQRIAAVATARGIALDALEIRVDSAYGLTGSFAEGTARGDSDPARIDIRLHSDASDDAIAALVGAAAAASPALALLRMPVPCRFALHADGRQLTPNGLLAADAADARDPDLTYPAGPQPLDENKTGSDVVVRTAVREAGMPAVAAPGATTRLLRYVTAEGRLIDRAGSAAIETWLNFPGASHFRYRTDASGAGAAPSGLALLAAGLAFCYMTQLSRYIEHMPSFAAFRDGRGARIVQVTPFAVTAGPDGKAAGATACIDTHVFLDGQAPADLQAGLVALAARTCFLRATAAVERAPVLRITHNGAHLD